MTAGAIRADGLLRFPMAFETSVVRPRHRLERMKRRWIRTRPRQRHNRQRFVRYMAKRAVVVIGLLVVLCNRLQSVMRSNRQRFKSKPGMPTLGHYSPLRLRRGVRGEVAAHCNPTLNLSPLAGRGDEPGNHVLMFVVRKVYLELALVFWLRGLIRAIRFAESEPPFFTRRGAQVTYRTDRRASPDRRLTCKKLRPMTTHARVVIRKIRDIRERSVCGPCRRNFVTSVAFEAIVFVRRL